MILWLDADSLNPKVRELCARRSGSRTIPNTDKKATVQTIMVAAVKLQKQQGACVEFIRVSPELTPQTPTADDYILLHAQPNDILVTRDIPLAAKALERGIFCLNDRGDIWNTDTIRERLSLRDHMAELRAAGLASMQRQSAYSNREYELFARALDKVLQEALHNNK